MDSYCIGLGYLLDNPSVVTLEEPDQHSVHCLVDVSVCVDSDFNVLAEPTESGGLYSVAYKLDEAGKETLIQLARQEGIDCSTCTDDGMVTMGFRAELTGVVQQDRVLQVVTAIPSNGRTNVCQSAEEPTTTPVANGVPTTSTATVGVPTMVPIMGSPVVTPVSVEAPAPVVAPVSSSLDSSNSYVPITVTRHLVITFVAVLFSYLI